MKRLALVALLSLAGPAAAQDGGIAIAAPWARAAFSGTGAAYVTIANTGTAPDRLISAESPAARLVDVHTSLVEDGIMKMRRVDRVEINPGQKAIFQPSGLHLMLTGLTGPLKEGESLALTLTFEKAGKIELRAPIGKAGAMGPPAR